MLKTYNNLLIGLFLLLLVLLLFLFLVCVIRSIKQFLFFVSAARDQVDQVFPAHLVDDIDKDQVDPIRQVDHKDALTFSMM